MRERRSSLPSRIAVPLLRCALYFFALGGCTLLPTTVPGGTPDLDQLRFIAQVSVDPDGRTVIDLGVANDGAVPVVVDDAFGGVWELVGPDGKTIASERVERLPRVPPRRKDPQVHRWRARLEPGSYKLTWGALGHGSTVVYFDLNEAGQSLQVASSGAFQSASYPPSRGVRAKDHLQTDVADFSPGQMADLIVSNVAGGELQLATAATHGTYTSTVLTAEFPFNAIVAHWSAHVPPGSLLTVELRTSNSAGEWSQWRAGAEVEWSAQEDQFYPEVPLLLSDGRSFQYRVTIGTSPQAEAAEATSPVLRDVTLTYIDTTIGPTTAQAQAVVQMGPPTTKGAPQPALIPRRGWGADESFGNWKPEYTTVEKIVVHHTMTPNDYGEDQGPKWVRAIYYYHAVTRKWGDIGYNYLVDAYGNIYEGRYGGPGVAGGHVYGYNRGTVGVGLIGVHGNHPDSVTPTDKSWSALTDLSAWLASHSYIDPLKATPFRERTTPNLGGHRDYMPESTSCPGDLAYARLAALRQSVWGRLMSYVPRYDVEWVAWEDFPTPLQTHQTYSLTVSVRNAGWFTWPQAGGEGAVRLACQWQDSKGQALRSPAGETEHFGMGRDLSYGQVNDFRSVPIRAPGEPGTYTLVCDMVHEGKAWFHDANPDSPLMRTEVTVVQGPPPQPTPTSSPTPSPTPTLMPTPSPTPVPDFGAVANGGFEEDAAWTIHNTARPARYSDQVSHNGRRALLTGIQEGERNTRSYSSAEQMMSLPGDGEINLRYWVRARVDSGDQAYVFLQPAGGWWKQLHIIRGDVGDWTEATYSLQAYAGQTITLRFGIYNNGRGQPSSMYVDDVSVAVEGVQQPAETPALTPTLPPTATLAPTATPTPLAPTATPVACAELAVNGGFEGDAGWRALNTPHRAHYTQDVAHTGSRSMQLGISDPAENRLAFSSVEQVFHVPAGTRVALRFWYDVPDGGGIGDYAYFLVRPVGAWRWDRLELVRDRTDGWTPFEADLGHLAGKQFALRLEMRNDGRRDGRAAVMYVDDLSLQACNP